MQVAARLTLAHSLLPSDIVESFSIEVVAQKRAITAPGRGIKRHRVGRANLPHHVEQYVFQGDSLGRRGRVRYERFGKRMNLEQR